MNRQFSKDEMANEYIYKKFLLSRHLRNANQNHIDVLFYLSQNTSHQEYKSQQMLARRWIKGNPYIWLVDVLTSSVTMEIRAEVSHMTQLYNSWMFTQRTLSQYTTEILVY